MKTIDFFFIIKLAGLNDTKIKWFKIPHTNMQMIIWRQKKNTHKHTQYYNHWYMPIARVNESTPLFCPCTLFPCTWIMTIRCLAADKLFPPSKPIFCEEKNVNPYFEIKCCSTSDKCNQYLRFDLPKGGENSTFRKNTQKN